MNHEIKNHKVNNFQNPFEIGQIHWTQKIYCHEKVCEPQKYKHFRFRNSTLK